jgi:hypothetical protein
MAGHDFVANSTEKIQEIKLARLLKIMWKYDTKNKLQCEIPSTYHTQVL